jgi:protocatechuate 3,4-dioxygenase beta subunit
MHDDDKPIGRILTRREVLGLLGATSVGLVAARAAAQEGLFTNGRVPRPSGESLVQAPACVVRPQQTEGPYFVDEKLDRSDIRSDPASGLVSSGLPLALSFRVVRVGSTGCAPLEGAIVDVWQCDAMGQYSDVTDGRAGFNNKGKKFLRGFQRTDAAGGAKFTTIYPGWYQGRAVHIHFKIRTSAGDRAREFTSQLYFDDALNAKVFAAAPYSSKGIGGLIPNSRDGIFRNGGKDLMLDVKPVGDGYAGTFDIGLNV